MAELSNDLIAKLKKAQNPEEVAELLKADGHDEEDAEKIWGELEKMHAEENQELSLDELDAVAGGRDWLKKGCAATVEPGSNCWGTDGGCKIMNIKYDNKPCDQCCMFCGARYTAFMVRKDGFQYYACRECGAEFYFNHTVFMDSMWVRLN